MGAYRHVVVRPRDLHVGSAADTSTSSSISSSSSSSSSSGAAVPAQSIEAWMRHQFQVSVTITAITVTTVTSAAVRSTAVFKLLEDAVSAATRKGRKVLFCHSC
jgi:hypothetical protein